MYIYIYTRGAYIEGTAGVIFFPNPSPPPLLDFVFPRSMFPFCFVLINSSVMCLQDETRSVSQDHKERRALVGSRTVKGARSICSPQFPPLPAKFRRLFASFFFHSPRGSAALRQISFTVYREIKSGRGRKKRGGAELSRFTPPPPPRLVSFKRARLWT